MFAYLGRVVTGGKKLEDGRDAMEAKLCSIASSSKDVSSSKGRILFSPSLGEDFIPCPPPYDSGESRTPGSTHFRGLTMDVTTKFDY